MSQTQFWAESTPECHSGAFFHSLPPLAHPSAFSLHPSGSDQFLYNFLAFLGRYRGLAWRPKNPPGGRRSFATTPVARRTSARKSPSKVKTSGRPDVRMS